MHRQDEQTAASAQSHHERNDGQNEHSIASNAEISSPRTLLASQFSYLLVADDVFYVVNVFDPRCTTPLADSVRKFDVEIRIPAAETVDDFLNYDPRVLTRQIVSKFADNIPHAPTPDLETFHDMIFDWLCAHRGVTREYRYPL